MKTIKIKDKEALVDDEDYDWLNDLKWWTLVGRKANPLYPVIFKNGKYLYMHRLVMFAHLKEPTNLEIDHIDRNPLNNQKSNLRWVTHSQNCLNRKGSNGTPKPHRSDNPDRIYTSEFRGVARHKYSKKWEARIRLGDKKLHIGIFPAERWAAMAYDIWAKEIYKDKAKLNFPVDKK